MRRSKARVCQRRRRIGSMSSLVLALGCGGRAIDGTDAPELGTDRARPPRGSGAVVDPGTRPPTAGDGSGGGRGPGRGGATGSGPAMGAGQTLPTPDLIDPAIDPTDEETPVDPESCPLDPVPLVETVEILANAASQEAPEDRPFIRYVSAGQYRTACSSPMRIGERARAAVDKLVNSASIGGEIVPTRPLDPDGLLLRIDLRDYGWAQPISVDGTTYPDGWQAIVAKSGLALEFEGGAADVLKEQVGTAIPWLLVGSFVAAVTGGELYYALTEAPSTLGELKARLGITPADDLPAGVWQRAGFSDSGVSQQPRGVARYAGGALGAGMFWQTFDYSPTSNLPGVFLDPLGIQADAMQAIYLLRNGLPAYFAADATGRRLTESPFAVDPAQRNGVTRVLASCPSCHNAGLILFRDTVRDFVETNLGGSFTPAQMEAVGVAYPPPSVMADQVAQDSERLRVAMARAGQREGTPDPVSRVALDYDLDADLDTIAGELYQRRDALDLDRLPAALAAASANGVARASFEASYREAMCELHTGPIVPVGCRP